MQICRTKLGYIKKREKFNNKNQQNCQEFLEVAKKA